VNTALWDPTEARASQCACFRGRRGRGDYLFIRLRPRTTSPTRPDPSKSSERLRNDLDVQDAEGWHWIGTAQSARRSWACVLEDYTQLAIPSLASQAGKSVRWVADQISLGTQTLRSRCACMPTHCLPRAVISRSRTSERWLRRPKAALNGSIRLRRWTAKTTGYRAPLCWQATLKT